MQTSRDYLTEMRVLIDSKIKDDRYIPELVAKQIVETLRESDPELLAGWLELHAADFLRTTIISIGRSKRTHVRTTAKGKSFRAAATHATKTGDTKPLQNFLDVRYAVDINGTRKKLPDMMTMDLMFVAEGYANTAKRSALISSFMRKLAIKVGVDKVSDHFSDEQLLKMWSSLS